MSLPVYSLFPYSKKGEKKDVDTVRNIVARVKACRIGFLEDYFEKHLSEGDKVIISSFIPENATLIPLPKSAPLVENALWPSRDICEFLIKRGFGNSFSPILKRISAVPKAAFQHSSEDRPSVQKHFDSISLEIDPLFSSNINEIILVDDVVTQGRTAFACY